MLKLFKNKCGDEDKNKSDKLMSPWIDNDKLLEKYKIIFTKIEDLKSKQKHIAINFILIFWFKYARTCCVMWIF